MRTKTLSLWISAFFVLLAGGLFFKQIVKGSAYRALSENNRIRIVSVEGVRGGIYDRNGVPLVDNTPALEAVLLPQELPITSKGRSQAFANLEKVLGVERFSLQDEYNSRRASPFAPFTVLREIDRKKAFYLEEHHLSLPGVMVRPKAKRSYIYGEIISHPLGYLGKINQDELGVLRKYGYISEDWVGRSGIERVFDEALKGKTGGMQIEVDSAGRQVNVLGFRDPSRGNNLGMTIDVRLQKFVYELMQGRRGAAVALEPKSGEILAMVSMPSYDPNVFITPGRNKEREHISNAKDKRLLNRALSCTYPAGSIFKIVVAYAALKTGKISPRTTFFCDGTYRMGESVFSCTSAHGKVDIEDGLRYSCNIFFYNTGKVLGIDLLSHYAKGFGLGRTTGIEIWEEVNGLVPNRMWKRWNYGEVWYPGDTINLSIGQGFLQITPLQAARMVAILVNGGMMIEPHLVSMLGDSKVERPPVKISDFSKSAAGTVQRGLHKVVAAEGGTGRRAAVPGLEVCGKTGTAEVGPGKEPHSWFVGYAPGDNPKVAFAVVIEHGGHGGGAAAEVAGEMLKFMKESGML